MKTVLSLVFRILIVATAVGLASPPIAKCTPPWITNVPPGTSVEYTTCGPALFDFDGMDGEGDPFAFVIVVGPGTIDSMTGLWTWQNVAVADTGSHSLTVRIWKMNIGMAAGSNTATVIIIVSSPPTLMFTSGCNTDVMLTGDSRQVQMGTSNGACDDNIWSMSQVYGPPSGATCKIDSLGLIQFSATNPANYEYRVIVTDGVTTDTCTHSFIVHGGPGCCVLQRGNIDGVAGVDLSDLSRMIAYMYNAFTILPCWDEANVNRSGIIDLTDLSILISYLTVPGSVTLANCPGSLGH